MTTELRPDRSYKSQKWTNQRTERELGSGKRKVSVRRKVYSGLRLITEFYIDWTSLLWTHPRDPLELYVESQRYYISVVLPPVKWLECLENTHDLLHMLSEPVWLPDILHNTTRWQRSQFRLIILRKDERYDLPSSVFSFCYPFR